MIGFSGMNGEKKHYFLKVLFLLTFLISGISFSSVSMLTAASVRDEKELTYYSEKLFSQLSQSLATTAKPKGLERFILKSFRLSSNNADFYTLRTVINRFKEYIASSPGPVLVSPLEIRLDRAVTSVEAVTLDSTFEPVRYLTFFKEQNIQGIMDCEMTVTKKKISLNATIIDSQILAVIYSKNFEETRQYELAGSSNTFVLGAAYHTIPVKARDFSSTVEPKDGFPSSIDMYGIEFGFNQRFLGVKKAELNLSALGYFLTNGVVVPGLNNMLLASQSGSGFQGAEVSVGVIYNFIPHKKIPSCGFLKVLCGYGRFFGANYKDFGLFNLRIGSDLTDSVSLQLSFKFMPVVSVMDPKSVGMVTSGSPAMGFVMSVYLN